MIPNTFQTQTKSNTVQTSPNSKRLWKATRETAQVRWKRGVRSSSASTQPESINILHCNYKLGKSYIRSKAGIHAMFSRE
eukprot:1423292-Amphidinium_carterae.1